MAEWDADASGVVERDEFRTTVRQLGFGASDIEIDRIFDAWDYDGSGALETTELKRKLLQATKPAEAAEGAPEAAESTPEAADAAAAGGEAE